MRRALAVLALATAGPFAAADPAPVFLGAVAVEAAPGLDLARPVVATLVLTDRGPERVGSLQPWFPGASAAGDGAVTLQLPARSAVDAPRAEHRAPSFVVDFDEPELAPVRRAVAEAGGPAASIEDLTALADRWIDKKNLRRSFDVASVVARRREGDCTEHAVLLAAMARSAGRPARLVTGLAVVAAPSGPAALGHAWVEIHDGGRWVTADAAARSIGVPVTYLPMAVLADEGPSAPHQAFTRLSAVHVRALRLAPAAR